MTISADATLVELVATVREKQEHLIGGLKAANFQVLDDKQPREITFFSEVWGTRAKSSAMDKNADVDALDVPPAYELRTIALFFDDVHASVLFHKSAEAAGKLITNDLHPGDRVGIFTVSGTRSVDFTSNRDLLLAALMRLKPHPLDGCTPWAALQCRRSRRMSFFIIWTRMPRRVRWRQQRRSVVPRCPPGWVRARSGGLAAASGERIMILMSPGFPTGGMEKHTSSLIVDALRANIRISAVNSAGLETVSPKRSAAQDGEWRIHECGREIHGRKIHVRYQRLGWQSSCGNGRP